MLVTHTANHGAKSTDKIEQFCGSLLEVIHRYCNQIWSLSMLSVCVNYYYFAEILFRHQKKLKSGPLLQETRLVPQVSVFIAVSLPGQLLSFQIG